MYINSFYQNPYEHTKNDTAMFIDFMLLEKVTKGVLATILTFK